MSKARLIITAVTLEGRSQADVARDYNVSKSWVSKLIKRYKQEGTKAFEARSRKPHHRRPHRSLPHSTTPAALYSHMPKATPQGSRENDTHNRVRRDRVDSSGSITLRVNSKLHHIGIGRTHARTHVLVLVQDLNVHIINATTGEVLRDLTIDTTRDYQPQNHKKLPNP